MATSSFTDTVRISKKDARSLSKVLNEKDVKANTGTVRKVVTVERSEIKKFFAK